MSSATVISLNKPYQVLSQFTDKQEPPRQTLATFVPHSGVYPAGRLDYDSEGLLLLTDSGELQARISNPQHKLPKRYWVQVEGTPNSEQLQTLCDGVELKDGKTRRALAKTIECPDGLWPRHPAVTPHRAAISSWLDIEISEGKNRQVRRMCAKVGLPVLRLIRYSIGHWSLGDLKPGDYKEESVHLPKRNKATSPQKRNRK